jgi:hypothetical protein
VNGFDEGNTPSTVKVQRNIQSVEVSFRLDGYQTQSIKLKKEFNWWSLLNLTDPLGWIVDIATGAMFKYHPKGYYLELEPKKP